MDIFIFVGIGLTGAFCAVMLKQYKSEYAMLVSLATGLIILLLVLSRAEPVFEAINGYMGKFGSTGGLLLLKALGICIVTQLATDTCKDMGESATAAKLELAGKVLIIVLILPLLNELLSIATGLISG